MSKVSKPVWPQSTKTNAMAFIDPTFRRVFQPAHLLNFNALWELQFEDTHKISFPEAGASIIDRFEMTSDVGQEGFYIKRQLDRSVRSWRKPFGEPAFAHELRNIRLCEKNNIPTLEPVYYDQKQSEAGELAIIIVRALDGYCSLRDLLQRWDRIEAHTRQLLLMTAGKALARLHAASLDHGHLHPDDIIIDLRQIPQWRLASPQHITPSRSINVVLSLQSFLVETVAISIDELDCLLLAYLEVHPVSDSLSEFKQALDPSLQVS